MNKKQFLYISISTVLFVVIIILFFSRKRALISSRIKTLNESFIPVTENKKKLFLSPVKFPLKNGVRGIQVAYLQAFFNLYHGFNLAIDGIFGENTEKAANRLGRFAVSELQYNTDVYPHLAEIKSYISSKGIEIVTT